MPDKSVVAPNVILAEAVAFDPGWVILALVVLTALAIAAIVWTVFAIRFGYFFGRSPRDRQRMMRWAVFSLPYLLIVLDRINSGDTREFGWYLAILSFVVVPPLVGWAVQRFGGDEPPGQPSAAPTETQQNNDET